VEDTDEMACSPPTPFGACGSHDLIRDNARPARFDVVRHLPQQAIPSEFDFSKSEIALMATYRSPVAKARDWFPAIAKLLGMAA
jgi:hypothetical protein